MRARARPPRRAPCWSTAHPSAEGAGSRSPFGQDRAKPPFAEKYSVEYGNLWIIIQYATRFVKWSSAMSYRLRRLDEISPADRARFEADGFLVVEGILEPEHIED